MNNKQRLSTLAILSIEIVAIAFVVFFLKQALVQSDNHDLNTIFPMLLDIAFLAAFASLGGRLAKVLGIAPMAGKIVIGIIVGPAVLGVFLPDAPGVELARLGGILLILFEAGLHFDMGLLKKNLRISTAVALTGVFVPLMGFTFLGYYFFGMDILAAIFLGGVFTPTSIGLSVEALKRAGKLSSSLGNKIIGAALIDDVLAIVLLTILAKTSSGGLEVLSILELTAAMLLFLGSSYVMWNLDIGNKAVKYVEDHYILVASGPHTRLFFATLVLGAAAVGIIGLEPVLGAFGIGILFSKVEHDFKQDALKKLEGHMHIFVGAFLVSIGTLLPREAILNPTAWMLALAFAFFALVTKYVVKYLFSDNSEGHLVGLAMAIRGEVSLVFIMVGLTAGIIDQVFATASILAVVIVTIASSILFEKAIYDETGIDIGDPGEAF